MGEFGRTAKDVRERLEQALALIEDAKTDLAALEGDAAHNAVLLSNEAHLHISNVAYGWGRDIEERSTELARRILS